MGNHSLIGSTGLGRRVYPQGHQDGSASGGHFSLFVWAFLFCLVVYPLSIGPAALIHQKHPPLRPVIETSYRPLTELMEVSPPVERTISWYARTVWGVR